MNSRRAVLRNPGRHGPAHQTMTVPSSTLTETGNGTMTTARTDPMPSDAQVDDLITGHHLPDEPVPAWWAPLRAGEPLAAHAMRTAARYLDTRASTASPRAGLCGQLAQMLRAGRVAILIVTADEEKDNMRSGNHG